MLNKILSFSKQLISVPSTKENPDELKRVLELAKKEVGSGFTVEDFKNNDVSSCLIYNTSKRPNKFKIILNAHLDVVPAKPEQYKPFEKNRKLHGRGTYDMKAAAAVEILVFKELAKKLPYPIALQLVTDEEIGGFNGTKYQIDKGVGSDFSIAGEGTNLAVKNKAKGIVWAKIKTYGKTGHGAYLWQGKNAIWKMIDVLNKLKTVFPEPKKEIWKTTINVAKIETTNQTFNQVPDNCILGIDIRYIPEDDKKIVGKIKKLLPKGAAFELMLKEPAQFTSEKNQYLEILRNSATKVIGKKAGIIVKHGASDIRHFNRVGCDGIEYGPTGEGLHTDNEWVDIKSLENYYNILRGFLIAIS